MASARILVADDDQPLLELYTQWLADLGYQTVQATTGNAALGRAASNRLDGALIDLCLPDMSGLEVVEALSLAGVPSIVVTGNGSCATAVAAMRRGALDFVEKPIDVDEFSRVIRQLTDTCPTSEALTPLQDDWCPHSLRRWAIPVVKIVEAEADPRTLAEWAKCAGVSVGTLRNWCGTAGILPRPSLLFGRVLRATLRHSSALSSPEELLNIVDRRTLRKVLKASSGDGCSLPKDVETFFERQQFVTNPLAIAEIRKAMLQLFGVGIGMCVLVSRA